MFLDALPAADKAADARYGGTGFSSRVPVESLIPFIAFNDLLTGPLTRRRRCVTATTSHWWFE
jgi:hypothetical protein